jgi:catechol 2,3-dioxygenase-like lactoylglutathione lyase family enzyme
MKRFHVNVAVADLGRSIDFYRTLFGAEPVIARADYAKWMLDDPRVNFAITLSTSQQGINHVGVQAETPEELREIRSRLRDAQAETLDQDDARCCYAHSTKTWARDPDNVAWETFLTHEQIEEFGADHESLPVARVPEARCCG